MINFFKSILCRRSRVKQDKLMLKATTEAYDRGYKAGANQMNNAPCVCGFWGDKK